MVRSQRVQFTQEEDRFIQMVHSQKMMSNGDFVQLSKGLAVDTFQKVKFALYKGRNKNRMNGGTCNLQFLWLCDHRILAFYVEFSKSRPFSSQGIRHCRTCQRTKSKTVLSVLKNQLQVQSHDQKNSACRIIVNSNLEIMSQVKYKKTKQSISDAVYRVIKKIRLNANTLCEK